jgi:RNA-directed DNA polymerase
VYTRYADDLAFSGGDGFLRGSTRFAAHVGAVVLEQGLAVNFRKTRVMRQGVRQHLAGLVVNERVNVPRAEFDRLKAILTNCIRNGPEAENREGRPEFRAHLAGRVACVASVNAERGARLRMLLERIVWE